MTRIYTHYEVYSHHYLLMMVSTLDVNRCNRLLIVDNNSVCGNTWVRIALAVSGAVQCIVVQCCNALLWHLNHHLLGHSHDHHHHLLLLLLLLPLPLPLPYYSLWYDV